MLGIVPMISIATLFGGVTGDQITRTVLVLANTMVLSLTVGMFVSTLSRNDRKAAFAAFTLMLVLAFAPFAIGYWIATRVSWLPASYIESVNSLSPIYAFIFAQIDSPASLWGTGLSQILPFVTGPAGAGALLFTGSTAFYMALAKSHAVAWLLLILSSVIVPRICKDRPKGEKRARLSEWWRNLILGDNAKRAALRRRLLDRSPYLWLSGRERFRPALVWALIIPLTGIGIWIFLKFEIAFYESAMVLLGIVFLVVKVWFTGEVCNRWVEDRKSGALELLLCTPLQVREVIRGQGMALLRQFGWPVVTAASLGVVVYLVFTIHIGSGSATKTGRTWVWMNIPVLIADLIALRWTAMWLGLRARGLNRAIGGTLGRVLALRFLVYFIIGAIMTVSAWLGMRPAQLLPQLSLWLMVALILDAYFWLSSRHKFLKYFRMIAASPSDYENPVRPDATNSNTANSSGRVSSWRRAFYALSPGTRAAIFGAGALSLVVALLAGYRVVLKVQVEGQLTAIRIAGFPTTIEEWNQRSPLPKGATNVALVLQQVFPLLVAPNNLPSVWPNIPDFKPAAKLHQTGIVPQMRDAIVTLLSSNDAALKLVRATSSLKFGRYLSDWSQPSWMQQIQALQQVGQLIQMEVLLKAEDNDVRGAMDSLRDLFDLYHSLDREAFPGFQGSKNYAFIRPWLGLQWLLSRHALSDADLRLISREIGAIETQIQIQPTIAALRCAVVESFRNPPYARMISSRRPDSAEMLRMTIQTSVRKWIGANERDLLRFLAQVEAFINLSSSSFPDLLARLEKMPGTMPNYGSISRWSEQFNAKFLLQGIVVSNAELMARCRTARMGLMLERFRLQHGGNLPERLDQLVPEIVPEVPLDPFGGGPILFKKLAVGYQIYSVGKNAQDDNGAGIENPMSGRAPVSGADDISFTVGR
jgi:hypothetical protein